MEELSIWQARFKAQLISSKNSQPDSEAPLDPKTGRGKRYLRLDTFIRAILYCQLRAAGNAWYVHRRENALFLHFFCFLFGNFEKKQ